MVKLHFDYRDLFRSARLAFSIQRVWINFIGLFFGFLLYDVLTYVSFLTASQGFIPMWERFGLFPCLFGIGGPWYSWVIYAIGVLLLIAIVLLTNTAVSRAVYMNLKGETFYTWKEAFGFSLKRWGSVLAAPTAIIGIIVFFGVGAIIMGLLGRIPYVGELGTGLMTLFYMSSSLFVFFLILVLFVAFLFVPSIIATTDEDAFEAVFQSFSISTGQPWRIIAYGVVVAAIEILGFVILAWAVKEAFLIFNFLFLIGMGDKFSDLMNNGMALIQGWVYPTLNWIQYAFGDMSRYFYFARDFVPKELSAVMQISAWFFAVLMGVVGGLIVSYAEAIGNSGLTLVYLIMRKHQDDENLLERKEEEEEESSEEEKTEETPKDEKTEEKGESSDSEEKKSE
ncbi:hypothetical protein BMS3Abin05_01737 [bacterium BMS3Abin05]|nr:hypothetical protein BMS3Abin05_01737 [bacterium BMS3Abin05]HDZ10905.1 hypothetical protein [Bacteroidota bacterium]